MNQKEYAQVVHQKYTQIISLIQQYPMSGYSTGMDQIAFCHSQPDFAKKGVDPDYFDSHKDEFDLSGLCLLAKILHNSNQFPDLTLRVQRRNRLDSYNTRRNVAEAFAKRVVDEKSDLPGPNELDSILSGMYHNQKYHALFNTVEVRLWKSSPQTNSKDSYDWDWSTVCDLGERYIAGNLKAPYKDVEHYLLKNMIVQLRCRENVIQERGLSTLASGNPPPYYEWTEEYRVHALGSQV